MHRDEKRCQDIQQHAECVTQLSLLHAAKDLVIRAKQVGSARGLDEGDGQVRHRVQLRRLTAKRMQNRHRKIDVGATGSAYVRCRHFYPALIADDLRVVSPEVLAAGALEVSLGAERRLIVEGAALLAPVLLRIDPRCLQQAERFGPDFVVSRGTVSDRDWAGEVRPPNDSS